ncbi:mycothiol transferase [Nigerium massiliense]|uniref:mycothiol transferase n=1 Tax=Nigerium massiliense TaxID=1522317 RepID=UPI000590C3A0|nr:DUF664 domain-containing protein [Nigerium massiliense]
MSFLTPNASGELAVLKTFALQQLAQMRTTVHGLSDEQAYATPSASDLNLIGLLRHAGEVGAHWSAMAAAAPGEPTPDRHGGDTMLEELVDGDMTLQDALAEFDRCVELTAENFDAVTDLSAPVPVPEAPWFPKELTHWEARWCLTHITAEVARHVGHADIIRETIDGLGSYELNDLADGIEPGSW